MSKASGRSHVGLGKNCTTDKNCGWLKSNYVERYSAERVCVVFIRLVSETKAWVSETGKVGFGNSPIIFGTCGSATGKVGFGNWERRFRKLGNQKLLCLRSMRNVRHYPRPHPPPHPQYPLQNRHGQLPKPTKPVAEADKTSF